MACFERQPRGHRTLRPFPVRQSAFCKVRSAAPPPAAPGQQEQRCSARRSHLRHTRHPPAAPQRTPFATPGSSQHGCFHVQPPLQLSSALPVLFHQETAGAVPGFPLYPGSFALPIQQEAVQFQLLPVSSIHAGPPLALSAPLSRDRQLQSFTYFTSSIRMLRLKKKASLMKKKVSMTRDLGLQVADAAI